MADIYIIIPSIKELPYIDTPRDHFHMTKSPLFIGHGLRNRRIIEEEKHIHNVWVISGTLRDEYEKSRGRQKKRGGGGGEA